MALTPICFRIQVMKGCSMKTMHKAFFEGIATPLLAESWQPPTEYPANKLRPYQALIMRRLTVKIGLLTIFAFILPIPEHTAVRSLMLGITGMAILAYGSWFEGADLRFLWDCVRLNKELKYADHVGCVTEQFLHDEAEDRLVGLAGSVLYCNGKRGFDKIKARNEKCFKKIHRLFLQFGLVEGKWDKYFALAKETLKTEGVTAEA